jgi:hypothetical protein
MEARYSQLDMALSSDTKMIKVKNTDVLHRYDNRLFFRG